MSRLARQRNHTEDTYVLAKIGFQTKFLNLLDQKKKVSHTDYTHSFLSSSGLLR